MPMLRLHGHKVKGKVDTDPDQTGTKHQGHQVNFPKHRMGDGKGHQTAGAYGNHFREHRTNRAETKQHQEENPDGRTHPNGGNLFFCRGGTELGKQQGAGPVRLNLHLFQF